MDLFLSQLLIGFSVTILVLASMTGNLLVCLAIYMDTRLHRTENIFLGSLAVADLMVAAFVMTVAGVHDFMGKWVFGHMLCDSWIAVIIMCSTASILSLCLISIDRYIHVKSPFKYPSIVTNKMAVTSVVLIWIISAVVSALPVSMGLHRHTGHHRLYHLAVCNMDVSPHFAMASAGISFFLPCVIMVSVYCKLYLYSRQHMRSIAQLDPLQASVSDYKAAITIGVVMGVFLVCWLPFFCLNVADAFCKTCIPLPVLKVFTWLGYINSLFNPIIYTTLNSEIRQSFKSTVTRLMPKKLLSAT